MEQSCARLADAGIPLGSQTPLLAGVNDDVDVCRQLFHGLLRFRVKPYYLYQADLVVGTSHFRTAVSKGFEIIERAARAHDGLRRADIRDRRARRRRQDRAASGFAAAARGRARAPAQLRGPRLSLPRSPAVGAVRIGFTYDLRDDYLREGYTAEETAEFDAVETIEAIETALVSSGHTVDRIGGVKRLVARLAAGDRWDMVFNYAEGHVRLRAGSASARTARCVSDPLHVL